MNLFPRALDHCSNFPTSPTPRAMICHDLLPQRNHYKNEPGMTIMPDKKSMILRRERTSTQSYCYRNNVKDKYSGNRDFYTKIYGVSAFRVKCPLDQFWDTSSILEPIPFFLVFCAG